MRLKEIADRIVSKVEGGIVTDDSKYNYPFIYSLIHKARAQAISIIYQSQKIKRINNSWTQKFIPEYNKWMQDNDCVVLFDCPQPVSLDNRTDGLLYIGSIDWNCAYTRVTDRATLSSFNKYRYTKPNPHKPKVLYSDTKLEIYGDTLIREVLVDGIFNDPTQVPTFNPEFDQYPADEALISMIEDLIYKNDLRVSQSTPIDAKSDSQATTSITQPK